MEYASFKPGEVWCDTKSEVINAHGSGFLYSNDTYYWFGEYKQTGTGTAHHGVHCYSSKDLYNWDDEGLALKVSEDPESPITAGCILERPKVIYNEKTNKFVMWFHLELKGRKYETALAGVAQSDNVTGPYEFVECFQPNDSMSRDMTLFVDDDGSGYQFYSSEKNSTMHVSLLTDDYLSPSGTFKRIFEKRYMEAPAICKHEGKYWFIASGCTGWAPNEARSAVADSIFGPWKELGNPCVGAEKESTFRTQSTYILAIEGAERPSFIFVADRWNPDDLEDSRYIWLPLQFCDGKMKLEFMEEWALSYFGIKQ